MRSKSPRPPGRARYQRGPHLYQRRGVWYARGGALGRAGVSLKTSDRAEAEQRYRALLARPVGRDLPAAAAQESTLLALIEEWLAAPLGYTRRTKETAKQRSAAFGRWMGARSVTLPSQITAALVDDWILADVFPGRTPLPAGEHLVGVVLATVGAVTPQHRRGL